MNGIVVGREVYMRSDEDLDKQEGLEAEDKSNPSLEVPQSEYETVRTGGRTPESAFGMAL